MRLPFFANIASELDWWRYRRVLAKNQWRVPIQEVSLVNWAQNDFAANPLIDGARSSDQVVADARELSLAFLHWLRNEAPRNNGSRGYPELVPATDVVGTGDGLAQQAYVRESRRMVTMDTLTQSDIISRDGDATPVHHSQSVGVAWYNMDIHPTVVSGVGVNARVRPFTLPFGCFVSDELDNLIPACKNIGVTHLVNACTRVHPIEWMIGEVAALTAVECLRTQRTPQSLRNDSTAFRSFQSSLEAAGIALQWRADVLSHLSPSTHGLSHA
jgi:hypothetical protein